MSYEPRPDSVAFRALAHMELLHKGSEITTGLLATALGVDGNGLSTQLTRAVETGLLFVRQRGGHVRSPKFWSLVDHSHKETPQRELTAVQTRDEVMTSEACDSATDQGKDVASAVAVAPHAQAPDESAQVGGKDVSGGHAEQRPPGDSPSPSIARAMKAKQLRAPTRAPEKINISPASMRVALWSDGTLEVRRDPDDLVLFTKSEARAIVDYLNAIDIKLVDEETA